MENRFKRIGICGASGTGKTFLAKHIEEEYGLPFVNSSSSQCWEPFGFTDHKSVHQAAFTNPGKVEELQHDILEYRNSLCGIRESFVTDRTPIDHLFYYLNYFQLVDPISKMNFIQLLKDQVKYFDAFIFIKFRGNTIENNGIRITDPLYQYQANAVMDWIIKDNILDIRIPILPIDMWSMEYRIREVKYFMKCRKNS